MRYSMYFGYRIKHYGLPFFNKEQFQRMMNIVFIEGVMSGMNQTGSFKETFHQQKRYAHTKTLNKLTKRYPPESLYKEMIRLSQQNPMEER